MAENYLRQAIVVRKDLMLTQGKLAAMVAHAAMTFITSRLRSKGRSLLTGDDAPSHVEHFEFVATPEQTQWLTELDPGLEAHGQLSFAKIVCQVADEPELLAIEQQAKAAGLECHRVIDSGHTHCKPGTFVCIAIGPDWPARLNPVTGKLKVYR